ncbi:helix-turn-helix transcriptional regulator [Halomarina rubra]|uniref:Helix-turn-helix transcriptional regulator n=1 Tax=Halomarina rubra TaxID=2071873 RepID=A0ABD6AT06_9EURY|nr:MarR family transcriptional regulator [Halomarina rubra]
MTSRLFDEFFEEVVARRNIGYRLAERGERLSTDDLVEVVRHGPILEALVLDGPLDHRDIEARLDVSRATSHRFTRWLDEEGYLRRVAGGFELTGPGQVVAEEVLRLEYNVSAAHRLAPLLEHVCADHQEFVVEPFAEATVTVADPGDPFRPMRRILDLVADSTTLRGFNATAMVPPGVPEFYDRLFDANAELVGLPASIDTLAAAYPDRIDDLRDSGRLALYARDALPYGLLVLDDCVGIGGYDEDTGTLRVFVDSEDRTAREWAERAFEAYKSDSTPLDDRSTSPTELDLDTVG